MLTKTSKYALQALILIASSNQDDYFPAKQIAAALKIPKEYLVKVLRILVEAGFVISLKGPQGGFCLARDPREITVYDIVKTIEGTEFFQTCILRADACDEKNPCALHLYWLKIRGQMRAVLDRATLHDLVSEMKAGKRVLHFADNVFLVQHFKNQIGIR